MSRLAVLAAVVAVLGVAGSAVASFPPPPVQVPEPGTLTLLGVGVAALVGLAVRSRRRGK